jgi:hypothetical protein
MVIAVLARLASSFRYRRDRLLDRLVTVRPGMSRVHLRDLLTLSGTLRKLRFGDELILEIPHPGIGDHLMYSGLPELVVGSGAFRRVLISTRSRRRNPEILDLIWRSNPFVAGFTSRSGWRNSGYRREGSSFLDGLVFQFSGVYPEPGTTGPKLYGPAATGDGPAVIDLQRVSNRHSLDPRIIAQYLAGALGESPIVAYESELLTEVLSSSPVLSALVRSGSIGLRSREAALRDYFERIRHASRLYSLYSGGAMIAAAFGVPCTVFCEFRDPAISFRLQDYIVAKPA